MTAGPEIERFLDAYRGAFETFDAPAIADLFAYPATVVGDAPGGLTVARVVSREAWLPQIERLLEAYRAMGVRSAQARERCSMQLARGLAQVTLQWRLLDETGDTLYDFDASYTLVDQGQGLRIVAVAHNETTRLIALTRGRTAPSREHAPGEPGDSR